MLIIGLVGKSNSGKDTIANYLVSNFNFKKMSFASSLKDALSSIFNWDRNLLEGDTLESRNWRETIDTYWNMTPRQIMQYVGTNLFRNNFDKDIWIKSLLHKINSLPIDSKIVVTDCRFPNEIESLKNINASIFRVNRNEINIFQHESENDIENIYIDYEIDNKGTVEDLHDNIKSILKSVNKI